MIYLDNASTSYPKPTAVKEALSSFYDSPVGSYGRSGDARTLKVSFEIEQLRDALAASIGSSLAGEHLVFTQNATQAINMVLRGADWRQDEVLVSPMEHNAVTRPLSALSGSPYRVMPAMPDGKIDLEVLEKTLKEKCYGSVRLVIINGMSNVNGLIQPLEPLTSLVHRYLPSAKILLDAAQALPFVKIEADRWGLDYVAITGHKGLLGPSGTGALFVREAESLRPLIRGGNGFRSRQQSDSLLLPDRFEAGTLNLLGLYAWRQALKVSHAYRMESSDWLTFLDALRKEPYLKLYTASDTADQGPLFSMQSQRFSTNELGDMLREPYAIACRSGLHCAPLAHETLGTIETGTVRVSISPFSTGDDLAELLQALRKIHA